MLRNTAAQKWRVFAFDRTNNVPKIGDAANITAKISKDWAAAAAVADTNPTEQEDGYYLFDIAQGESDAHNLDLFPESSTANIQVIGSPASQTTVDPAVATILAAVDTEVAAIKAKTDNLPSDPADQSLLIAEFALISALLTPELAEIKAKTDNLPSDPADQSLLMAEFATISALLTPEIAEIKAKTDLIVASGALESTALAIKAKTDNLPVDPADESLLQASIATVIAKTDLIPAAPASETTLQDIQKRIPTIERENTAQAGTANTITLDAGANATNDFYQDMTIVLTGGTGSGQRRQIRFYGGTTKQATVLNNWITNPDVTTIFRILNNHIVNAGVEYWNGIPTATAIETLVGEIKAKTDNLPVDPADESQLQASIAAISVLLTPEIADIKAKTDLIVAGGALEATSAAIKLQTDLIVAGGALEVTSLAIKAKTDALPLAPANEATSAAIKLKTDLIVAGGALEATALAIKVRTDLLPDDPADQSLIVAQFVPIEALLNNEVASILANSDLVIKLLQADKFIDNTTNPWELVYREAGTVNELLRQPLRSVDGVAIVSSDVIIGQAGI